MASSLGDELARAVLGEPTFSGPQAAVAAGVSFDDARRLWRAMGFPPVDDAPGAAAIALALVRAYGRDPLLPAVRVGLALGPVLAWQGDLYGPTVNLASRLVNVARAGTVLAAQELGEELARLGGFTLRHVRAERLKGIGRVRMWVVRERTS